MTKLDNRRREDLGNWLDQHPEIRDRVEALLDIADNKEGNANKADDAEDLIWEELRQMVHGLLRDWAERKHQRLIVESDQRRELSRKEKKGSTRTRRSGVSG